MILGIDQRPTAIAGIDRRRGLYDALLEHFLFGLQELPESAHDTGRKCIAQAKRVSDRQNFLADFQLVGIAQLGRNMPSLQECHMEQRDIRLWIASDQLCWKTSPIMQRHRDVGGPVHNMGIGHDRALLIDQHTCPESFARCLYDVMGADIR